MAAPAGVTPLGKYVIISIIDDVFAASDDPGVVFGNVELIGPDVLNVSVNDQVFFNKKTGFNFLEGDDVWYSVEEKNIQFTYTPV